MKIVFCAFVVLCLITVSMVSSLQTPYSCDDFGPPMEKFAVERYDGAWLLHQMYDFPGSHQYECFVLVRTLRPDGNLNVTQVLLKPGELPELEANGVSTFNNPRVGRYIYTSADNPAYDGTVYIILYTDYSSFTVEYSCKDLPEGGSEVEFYVMTRQVATSSYTQGKIDKIIAANPFDRDDIRKMNMSSCPEEVKRGKEGLLKALLDLVGDLLGGVLGVVGGLLG